MSQYVPYVKLTKTEQEAIHQWLSAHGIDHNDVPADGPIAYDVASGEWSVDRLKRRNGTFYLDGTAPARETVRFRGADDLPWRSQGCGCDKAQTIAQPAETVRAGTGGVGAGTGDGGGAQGGLDGQEVLE